MKSLFAKLRRSPTAQRRWHERYATMTAGYAAVADRSLTDDLYLQAIDTKITQLLAILTQHLGSLADRTILDAGCGYGNITQTLHTAGADVLGIDFIAAAVNRAQAQYPDCRFAVGDLANLRLNRTFDAIVTIDTLINVVDHEQWAAMLDGFALHLAEGGIAIILERMLQPEEHIETAPHVCFRTPETYQRTADGFGLTLIDHHTLWIEAQGLSEDLIVFRKATGPSGAKR